MIIGQIPSIGAPDSSSSTSYPGALIRPLINKFAIIIKSRGDGGVSAFAVLLAKGAVPLGPLKTFGTGASAFHSAGPDNVDTETNIRE